MGAAGEGLTPFDKLNAELEDADTISKEVSEGKRIGFYRIRGKLGKGAFSQVKMGMHILTKEHVAVKIIDKGLQGSQATLDMLTQEVAIMDLLHHPNVLRLYEVIETLDKFYCVVEFIDGGNLQKYISRKCTGGKKLTDTEVRFFFAQIVDAVDHLHSKNVTHRDLKTENVLMNKEHVLKVADFGISSSKQGLLKTHCGTLPYSPPEIFGKAPYVGAWVDIWSLGVILFELLTGRLPFAGVDRNKIRENILALNYTMPAHVSEGAADLVKAILVANPEDRLALADIKCHEWMKGCEYSKALSSVDLQPEAELTCQDDELVQKELRELGVPSEKIMEGVVSRKSDRGPRDSMTGTYRIALHRVQMQKFQPPKSIEGIIEEDEDSSICELSEATTLANSSKCCSVM